MLTTAILIVNSALLRKGSVGAHYRSDFKEKGENWQKHTACITGKDAFWTS
jgi:L-aspartate oxidase